MRVNRRCFPAVEQTASQEYGEKQQAQSAIGIPVVNKLIDGYAEREETHYEIHNGQMAFVELFHDSTFLRFRNATNK